LNAQMTIKPTRNLSEIPGNFFTDNRQFNDNSPQPGDGWL
jgi:hypothetical protein